MVLGSDREQADARPRHAENDAVINLPHHGELLEVTGFGIHIGAHIEQHRSPALGGGENGCQRRPVHACQHPEHDFERGHHGPRVAGADEPVGLALAHQARSHANGGVALAAKGFCRRVFHGDGLAGVNDLDAPSADGLAVPPKLALQTLLGPHQDDLSEALARREKRPLDFRLGSQVRTHCVHDNSPHRHTWWLLLERLYLRGADSRPVGATLVVAPGRASVG